MPERPVNAGSGAGLSDEREFDRHHVDAQTRAPTRTHTSRQSQTDRMRPAQYSRCSNTLSGREDYIDEGFVHKQIGAVFDETEPPKLIHKETHP